MNKVLLKEIGDFLYLISYKRGFWLGGGEIGIDLKKKKRLSKGWVFVFSKGLFFVELVNIFEVFEFLIFMEFSFFKIKERRKCYFLVCWGFN